MSTPIMTNNQLEEVDDSLLPWLFIQVPPLDGCLVLK